ncbi:peptidoglycan D,D-transpeptidase FtsI family protein [Paramicrobacterium agarici]|uniref:Cell elongation-specific peptidoglycan D,D-transpeptidase n=1 Tax=Paramicrobacterium agarici TaxID=630514 RepID=A0A2A9DS83_9MICO|nr:penicillin-binding transpeptidase domain-containing protein [Microbacterium agarici]PFG29647.1 cell elongation-specific peptidoglycan D,D-transpeptidase [Microbacterium agarici]
MNKEFKRVSVVVVAMFLALFVSTTVIQGIQADALAADPRNTRTLYDSYQTERGAILAGDTVLATSKPTGDRFVYQREYPQGEKYAAITGYFNPTQGSSGLEHAMNQYLSGTSNSQFLDTLNQIIAGQDPKGAAVEVTVDPKVQDAAWEAMQGYTGGLVALEPKTGRVLAMVTTPTYDPNALAVHDGEAVLKTYDQLLEDAGKPLYNRAIAGDQNPPGSTFKVVVAAAAFASGDYTPESTLPNPASYTLPGTSTKVYNSNRGTCGPGDEVTISDAIRLSCNIPMAELGVELGDEVIRETAESFGFNDENITIPLQCGTSHYPQEGLNDAQTALSAFGQGDVRSTPLQMAMVSAGIANEGTVMQPTLVDRVTGRNLEVLQSFTPSVYNEATPPDVAADVSAAMQLSVRSGAASNATIDGVNVAGKTGTAENGSDEPYSLWFTGFAPADNPQVAVAVVIEDGGGKGQSGSGNEIAAPVAKKVIEAVLNE